MKNPITDPTVALDHDESKDKRTLVLFLFGCLLLAWDLWPDNTLQSMKRYAVALHGNISMAVVECSATGPSQGTTFDPAVPIGSEIPARYAIFLHQPLAINRADQKSLELLPGVGPHLAEALVDYVDGHGPVSKPEDLLHVPGIGPKTLERLRPLIHCE